MIQQPPDNNNNNINNSIDRRWAAGARCGANNAWPARRRPRLSRHAPHTSGAWRAATRSAASTAPAGRLAARYRATVRSPSPLMLSPWLRWPNRECSSSTTGAYCTEAGRRAGLRGWQRLPTGRGRAGREAPSIVGVAGGGGGGGGRGAAAGCGPPRPLSAGNTCDAPPPDYGSRPGAAACQVAHGSRCLAPPARCPELRDGSSQQHTAVYTYLQHGGCGGPRAVISRDRQRSLRADPRLTLRFEGERVAVSDRPAP
ncbi:uncharacterized protein LOC126278885 [Schistocerca gregaria]|uniref:uncharacterized protein LOC126278885 n=1 Tax=Schistocerca gregaria TaxID=7010 RepID=UPI00211E16A8|nr:uncharacterized protein LOC126278885 [Schistocerca gregaria]